MKCMVDIRRQSNDQLKNRLREIDISLIRVRAYTKGNCMPPSDIKHVKKTKAQLTQSENTMYAHKLKREKARILTVLREREIKREQEKGVKKHRSSTKRG